MPPNRPVLLLGAGPGPATVGLLYLGSYLRRRGVEAFVRPLDTATSLEDLERRVHAMLDLVKPAVVGISLKWFLHIARALHIARYVKAYDPEIRIVLGGDTASHYVHELLLRDEVDAVARGDGEAPLYAFALGRSHPNLALKGSAAPSDLVSVEGLYRQDKGADDSYLSDLPSLALCESDRYLIAPFVVGAKGCSQACLYCGGARTAQATNFGRKRSFLRPEELVRGDIAELAALAYTLVYDFSDHPLADPTEALGRLWEPLDLTKSGILYYAWHVPPKRFIELLASRHQTVTLGLDFGCFSERQRRELNQRHLLKPLPNDAAYLDVIEECSRFPNVRVRVSGVAGLPLFERGDLALEQRLIETLLQNEVVEDILWDRVHAQPGAPVLVDPASLGVASPVTSFQDFLDWSEEKAPNGDGEPPLLTHLVAEDDSAIADAHRAMKSLIHRTMASRERDGSTLVGFPDLADRAFRMAPRARVINRSTARAWWLASERPEMKESALDQEFARIATGHFWDREHGAVAIPGPFADLFLPAFRERTTAGAALAAIRSNGVKIEERVMDSALRLFFESRIIDAA